MSTEYGIPVYRKCFLANAQSIRNKLPELHYALCTLEYDVLAFTETFLTSGEPDSLILSGNSDYCLQHWDRSGRRCGEVALFVKHSLCPVPVQVPSRFRACECVATDLFGTLSYRIACVYRPPGPPPMTLCCSTSC